MNESLCRLLPFIYKNHALPKLSKYETNLFWMNYPAFLPDFSRSSCLWMAKTGDTCQLLHHRIATRRTRRGLMACCFSAQETLLHEITTCRHCRGNASKPFKIFACLKSQCDQSLRRLRVMATLEWTPSASCKQFTWSRTVQETSWVSTRNLFELSVDYMVFPCISSRFTAVVNLWNHWDVLRSYLCSKAFSMWNCCSEHSTAKIAKHCYRRYCIARSSFCIQIDVRKAFFVWFFWKSAACPSTVFFCWICVGFRLCGMYK